MTAEKKSKKIGIIGLGVLGGYIADNFIDNGYTVFVHSRTESVMKTYIDKGATACLTPEDVAHNADLIFEATPNDDSSKEVWTGKYGILEGAAPHKILIACATLSAEWIDTLAEKCKKAGFHFFDMAVHGEPDGLHFLCGGNKHLLHEITPVLRAAAAHISYFGPVGQGIRYKLILNFLQAVHFIGFMQAMKIAKEQHMDLEKVGEALIDKPGGAITEGAWRAFQTPADQATFTIELITKDLTYAKKLIKHLDNSLLDNVLDVYKEAGSNGYEKRDWTSIMQLDH